MDISGLKFPSLEVIMYLDSNMHYSHYLVEGIVPETLGSFQFTVLVVGMEMGRFLRN